jgi:hypothetical protein
MTSGCLFQRRRRETTSIPFTKKNSLLMPGGVVSKKVVPFGLRERTKREAKKKFPRSLRQQGFIVLPPGLAEMPARLDRPAFDFSYP